MVLLSFFTFLVWLWPSWPVFGLSDPLYKLTIWEIYIICAKSTTRGRGGALLPYKRLMGMCLWMGSYFHDWIMGRIFNRVTQNGVAHFRFLGGETVLLTYS